jgi:beta-lactamase superfamily II metal-dependent hydrolase
MTTTKTQVTVRMYNVGFGDAFVVTVRRGDNRFKMLVDCGVHAQGQARPLAESVKAVITDLTDGKPTDVPHLDVVIATHHHADHIAGFALDDWGSVDVGEVWVPFVEDESDPDAIAVRKKQTEAARRLLGFIDHRLQGVDAGAWPAAVAAARAFALNSLGNAEATDRLLGRNGLGFATTPKVRFLPSTKAAENVIPTGIKNVAVHVLGPPRDPDMLKRMNPPSHAGWFALDRDLVEHGERQPLFPAPYVMEESAARAEYPHLFEGHQALKHLDRVGDEALLYASSILERSVNNTSIFFVLDIAGKHLVFPGDAQQGAWDHVMSDPDALALISDAAFLKIGHHGSHNGTPKAYIESTLQSRCDAMLPWGLVKRWEKTIPKAELLTAMAQHGHRVTRADAPVAVPKHIKVHADIWSEFTLSVG